MKTSPDPISPAPLNLDPARFAGHEDSAYERHLVLDHVLPVENASQRDKFEAVARSVRDLLSQRWIQTEQTYQKRNTKRIYYLSMEFLIGRALANNITNLRQDPLWAHFCASHNLDPLDILEQEPDPGLGNGEMGRLAACFLDSMATLDLPGMGYGLRYDYGIFKQTFRDGWQHEQPDHWLARPDPWEVTRHNELVEVPLNCSFEMREGSLHVIRDQPSILLGIPYDRPVVGYGGKTILTLRLWAASTPDFFDYSQFSSGDFVGALAETLTAETLTRVLYPDDSTSVGKGLFFLQEFFLVACSLADLIRRFRAAGNEWSALPDKVAIQLNDTHPALAVLELMRILLDEASLGWDEAWSLTQRSIAYTNHTLLPEALEKWPVAWFEVLIPRQLEILYEINQRFLDSIRARCPGKEDLVQRISLIEEGAHRRVRMTHLAILGSHSTNGVSAIHTRLLQTQTLPDLAALFPERFNNKTNGVTQRRFLLLANPPLAQLITEAIGDVWITQLDQLEKLKPLAADSGFRQNYRLAKQAAKARFADWLKRTTGKTISVDFLFDVQVKRIHEYKRQLLNALRIIRCIHHLRANSNLEGPPRVFIFSGKAAPSYRFAKLVIKLVNNLAGTIEADSLLRKHLQVIFVPDYCVSVAEHLIPASDVSNQISTAGYESSGTSGIKFMMNGALTVATRDGATIEMAEAVGPDNLFLFGLSAAEVANSRSWYNPKWHYDHDPDTRAVLDLISSNCFSRYERGLFAPIIDNLLRQGDRFMHLADLYAYCEAHQRLGQLYTDQEAWATKAILNIAASGRFSSDRTVSEYARQIWRTNACPVE